MLQKIVIILGPSIGSPMLSSPNAHQSMMSNPMMMNGPRMNGPMGSPMPPHMMSSPNGPMHPIAGLKYRYQQFYTHLPT